MLIKLTENQRRILKDLQRSWKRARGGVPRNCSLCFEFCGRCGGFPPDCGDCWKEIIKLFPQTEGVSHSIRYFCVDMKFGGVDGRGDLEGKSKERKKIFSDALISQIDELLKNGYEKELDADKNC